MHCQPGSSIPQSLHSSGNRCSKNLLENGQNHDKGLNTLKDATERLGEAIGEVRSLSHDLRSSLLDTLGLPAAIGQLAAEFQQRSGLTVTYDENEFDCQLVDGAAVKASEIEQDGLPTDLRI